MAQENQLQNAFSMNRDIAHDVTSMQPQQPTSSSSIQVISTTLLHNIDDHQSLWPHLLFKQTFSSDIEPCFPVRRFLFLAFIS